MIKIDKVKELWSIYSKQLVLLILVIALCAGYLFKSRSPNNCLSGTESRQESSTSHVKSRSGIGGQVCVDIKGAVARPGVYHLPKSARFQEAIKAAGGITQEADLNQINLAKQLMDQQIVFIPKIGEKASMPLAGGTTNGDDKEKINLNSATKEELTKINGVGDKKADKIIEYRQQHGPFRSPEEVKNINGFGEKTVEKLKDQLSV